jgi:hypothetical protein
MDFGCNFIFHDRNPPLSPRQRSHRDYDAQGDHERERSARNPVRNAPQFAFYCAAVQRNANIHETRDI